MQCYYKDIEEIKRNSFLYVEYSTSEYITRIILYSFLVFILIFICVDLSCDMYQIITKTKISHESIFRFFAHDPGYYNGYRRDPTIVSPAIPVILASIPVLIRSILLIGDIYFCNDSIYIKSVLSPGKLKIFRYEQVTVNYFDRTKNVSLVINNVPVLQRSNEYKEMKSSFMKLLFILKRLILSFCCIKIMKENDTKHNFPHHYDKDTVVQLLKDHGVVCN